MAESVEYRAACRPDLPAVARIFLDAFPESVCHYAGRSLAPEVIEDIFAIALDAEPAGLLLAALGGRPVGYAFAPSHFSRLPRVALLHGHLFRLLWGWATGRYGLGWRPALIAARNWLLLLREARHPEMQCDARILSVAVRPDCQGRGIGTGLMRAALDYLRRQRSPCVRLEVRPRNGSAEHVYRKIGFQPRGRTRDTQGEWVVMLKDMAGDEG